MSDKQPFIGLGMNFCQIQGYFAQICVAAGIIVAAFMNNGRRVCIVRSVVAVGTVADHGGESTLHSTGAGGKQAIHGQHLLGLLPLGFWHDLHVFTNIVGVDTVVIVIQECHDPVLTGSIQLTERLIKLGICGIEGHGQIVLSQFPQLLHFFCAIVALVNDIIGVGVIVVIAVDLCDLIVVLHKFDIQLDLFVVLGGGAVIHLDFRITLLQFSDPLIIHQKHGDILLGPILEQHISCRGFRQIDPAHGLGICICGGGADIHSIQMLLGQRFVVHIRIVKDHCNGILGIQQLKLLIQLIGQGIDGIQILAGDGHLFGFVQQAVEFINVFLAQGVFQLIGIHRRFCRNRCRRYGGLGRYRGYGGGSRSGRLGGGHRCLGSGIRRSHTASQAQQQRQRQNQA